MILESACMNCGLAQDPSGCYLIPGVEPKIVLCFGAENTAYTGKDRFPPQRGVR
jgi:hypothetical protein